MPYRDSPHQDIGSFMSFIHLNLFRPNEHKEDYDIRKPNDESSMFDVGDSNYIYLGEKSVAFKTKVKIVIYSSGLGFKDNKFPFA